MDEEGWGKVRTFETCGHVVIFGQRVPVQVHRGGRTQWPDPQVAGPRRTRVGNRV